MKNASIFQQLIIKVIVPVIIALILLAWINIHQMSGILVGHNNDWNKDVSEDVQNILEAQDFELGLIEQNSEAYVNDKTSELVNEVFENTSNIESVNLDSVAKALKLNPKLIDIYVIDADGVIVNTTFEKDLGIETFKAFGPSFRKFIRRLLQTKGYEGGNFSPESKTDRLRKYSYRATGDRKYVIELGVYSDEADEVITRVRRKIRHISERKKSVRSVDLFIGDVNPVPFNNDGSSIQQEHRHLYNKVIENKFSILEDDHVSPGYVDTHDTTVIENGKKIHYQYTYMPRENTSIYKNSVIRIVSDRSYEDEYINHELMIFSAIFGFTIVLLFIIILYATKSITKPINKLVTSVNQISEGDLSLRTDAGGSAEISNLAAQFNTMMDRLEEFNNGLEQKVKERTAEISQQKEEIETQRDQIESQRDLLADNNSLLEGKNKEIEEKNKRITDSIHYAKRIQTAILPTSELLGELVSDHFVLYKPKDIVSGDFYWASKKNGKSILVAADCTGHGVPGAFMSMIGNTLLNKIINEHGVTKPSEILSIMRDEVIESLKQTGADHESKDGMDIVICVLDEKTMELEYAGANNPLFLVQNDEFKVIKGDKQPVGYFLGKNKPFTNHVIKLHKGDRFYIFTDGYQDQFGGEFDRKFMVKRFKKLLHEISETKMASQKEVLNNTIEEWMINTKQVDDILVIGIGIE